MILGSGDVGIRVLMELCQRILDGKGIPADWATSVAFPIFRANGDIMNCGMYRGVRLLEHAMNIAEQVLEKRLRIVVATDNLQLNQVMGQLMKSLHQGGYKKNT